MTKQSSVMPETEMESIFKSFRLEFAGYARKALHGDEDKVQDAMQETIVRAVARQDRFNSKYGKRGAHAWLLSILKNVCREMRRPSRAIVFSEMNYDVHEETPEEVAEDQYAAVLDAAEAQEEHRTLQEVIAEAELTNLEWAVMTATRLGFETTDIAPELGMGTNTVRAHMSNAMPKLRRVAVERGNRLDQRSERSRRLDHRRPIEQSVERAVPV